MTWTTLKIINTIGIDDPFVPAMLAFPVASTATLAATAAGTLTGAKLTGDVVHKLRTGSWPGDNDGDGEIGNGPG